MDNRAVSPVVEKVLVAGIVVLFVGGMTTAVLGGLVPEYRTAAGQEVADRVVAHVADAIEGSVPAVSGPVDVTRRVEIPATIRSHGYELVVVNRTLTLTHPHPRINARAALELPPSLDPSGQPVESSGTLRIHISGDGHGRTLTLTEGRG